MFVTFSCQDGISGWLCEEMSGEGLSLDQMDVSGIDSILLGKQNRRYKKERETDAKNKTSSLIKLILDSIAGNTPLHLAARAGKTTAVATLLHQGATAAMKVNYKLILMGATMIIMEKMMMAVGKTVMMMTLEGQLRL